MAYNVEKPNNDVPSLLTRQDLAIAIYALAEVFNSFLVMYENESYEEMPKEEMEMTMNKLRETFNKFNVIMESTGGDK